jgi:hypothetical protein
VNLKLQGKCSQKARFMMNVVGDRIKGTGFLVDLKLRPRFDRETRFLPNFYPLSQRNWVFSIFKTAAKI